MTLCLIVNNFIFAWFRGLPLIVVPVLKDLFCYYKGTTFLGFLQLFWGLYIGKMWLCVGVFGRFVGKNKGFFDGLLRELKKFFGGFAP